LTQRGSKPLETSVCQFALETVSPLRRQAEIRSMCDGVGRCCQTSAGHLRYPPPQLSNRQREDHATRRVRRRGSDCRCCGFVGIAPSEKCCGLRHGQRRISAMLACAGTVTLPALFVGTAGRSSRPCCRASAPSRGHRRGLGPSAQRHRSKDDQSRSSLAGRAVSSIS